VGLLETVLFTESFMSFPSPTLSASGFSNVSTILPVLSTPPTAVSVASRVEDTNDDQPLSLLQDLVILLSSALRSMGQADLSLVQVFATPELQVSLKKKN
jgi:hypothetical protein